MCITAIIYIFWRMFSSPVVQQTPRRLLIQSSRWEYGRVLQKWSMFPSLLVQCTSDSLFSSRLLISVTDSIPTYSQCLMFPSPVVQRASYPLFSSPLLISLTDSIPTYSQCLRFPSPVVQRASYPLFSSPLLVSLTDSIPTNSRRLTFPSSVVQFTPYALFSSRLLISLLQVITAFSKYIHCNLIHITGVDSRLQQAHIHYWQ